MVEVFRTNITNSREAKSIEQRIISQFPDYQINFDLQDCDKILRIESSDFVSCNEIIELVSRHGLQIEMLE